jgi:glycosyltransferase involved in cell wall biosynthesis
MRVLRVLTRLNVGGPARQALALRREMNRLGAETRLVVGRVNHSEGDLAEIESFDDLVRIPSLRRSLNPLLDLLASKAIQREIQSYRPEVVHTHMAKAGFLGRLAAQRSSVPVTVHTYHGHVLEGYFNASVSDMFVAVERWLARRTDSLIAVSNQTRDELMALGIGEAHQWRVLPVGLDLHSLTRERVPPSLARSRLGLPKEGPVVGIAGRLVYIKDHETFIRAIARVRQQMPDVKTVVAGDGPLRPRLEMLARKTLKNGVNFLGWIDDLPTLYGALDVVVLTSRNEGTPTALIEAGAAGKPVVASKVGGVPEVVRDGETGSLVPCGDVEAFAEHILTLLREPARRTAMGRRASDWVVDRFSTERLARHLLELYVELLERKRLSGP